MKMMHPISRLLRRLAQFFWLICQPRHALPSVGLVVLGGCLTFIITPDDPEATTPASPPKRNEFPLVILDPGHGGRDEGTKWRGLAERELTLDLAFRVEKLLKIAGFRTELTRRDDTLRLARRAHALRQQPARRPVRLASFQQRPDDDEQRHRDVLRARKGAARHRLDVGRHFQQGRSAAARSEQRDAGGRRSKAPSSRGRRRRIAAFAQRTSTSSITPAARRS